MSNPVKTIGLSDLRAGDVLLCQGEGQGAHKVASETGSPYTHAAICISEAEAAEVERRVKKARIEEILSDYSYIAVFRQPDAWSERHVEDLNLFVNRVLSTKYNVRGIRKFSDNEEEHRLSINEKLNKYFEEEYSPDPSIKEEYFCSEFVADCFVATGFISPSAAVFYKSDTIAPVALGKDPTYGTFLGYLCRDDDVEIPKDDEFFNNPTFAETFGASKY